LVGIKKLIDLLEKESNLKIENASGLGIGLPGLVDIQNGVLGFSGNLKLKNYALKSELEKFVHIPIKIANDADVATLAEAYFGAGKNYSNFIMATIGTGIGGGIVISKKLISENAPYAGEIGHIKVTDKKVKCSCGEYGCFEAVASTKALVSMTAETMKKHKNSAMWQAYSPETVSGKTVFEFKDTDPVAKEVFDKFIKNLGDGLVSLANIFMPEAIVLGGAISNQKKALVEPLDAYVNAHIYAKNIGKKIPIISAKHTGNAGILGGRCLFY
jgi:glucokinase